MQLILKVLVVSLWYQLLVKISFKMCIGAVHTFIIIVEPFQYSLSFFFLLSEFVVFSFFFLVNKHSSLLFFFLIFWFFSFSIIVYYKISSIWIIIPKIYFHLFKISNVLLVSIFLSQDLKECSQRTILKFAKFSRWDIQLYFHDKNNDKVDDWLWHLQGSYQF